MRTRYRRKWTSPLALLACGVLALSGCAKFDNTAAGQTFTPVNPPSPESPPQAGPGGEAGDSGPGRGGSGPNQTQTPVPPPQGCKDFDKSVIATCLDTVAAVAAIPGDGSAPSALAGERKSGRVLLAAAGKDPAAWATIPVDGSGDGGLTSLALSPGFAEDQLVFAYITTPTDNRVVRLAKGQAPKPVLTGIPKGATGNRGAIGTDAKGALLVATGDAGNAGLAADPASLAGKVLRIDTSGKPAPGNPTAGSAVFSTGVHSPGGICRDEAGSRLWLTDRLADKDVVYRLRAGQPLTTPAWSWPDKPGVAGCADFVGAVGYLYVTTSVAGNLQNLPVTPDGAVTGKPNLALDGKTGKPPKTFGRLSSMSMINPQLAVAGTVNKDGGTPVSSDDRVVLISPSIGGNGGGKD
ncbi:PQQ-dependent sugar dehydrogenase [Amycolatopsis regifaucium]|uniref:Glucose dehydrogenase n=1 Tax=Amycolatopsis regifaucium TaxID=546365 RepID=A0A154MB65_9PSEU|nr:PQQ-dependent sugar dehydrogenase [Amycolatopsis regifaucium]KZB81520.1 glucose dehydrogenase [Amycolatopsis regifaucium]OKA06911.1 glucose dehydrogenase [Amycolatopsis regifaucium]SFH29376.1 Glucose / Sorbosone dehydrogenase [Amycolatopsis regifaucium]